MALNDKVYLSANDYLVDTWSLAAKVKAAGWQPEVLIALWRGGAPVGVAMHEYFKVVGWTMDHIPVKCYSYTGIGEASNIVIFSHSEEIFNSLKPGAKVLVVDDVFDSGRTAAAVKERLTKLGVDMRIACVYWKPEKNTTSIIPDYYAKDVGNEWIVFPHEIEGLTKAEIAIKSPELAKLL